MTYVYHLHLTRNIIDQDFLELFFCLDVKQDFHPKNQYVAGPQFTFQMEHEITVSSDTEGDKQKLCRELLIESKRLCGSTGGCPPDFANNRTAGLTAG